MTQTSDPAYRAAYLAGVEYAATVCERMEASTVLCITRHHDGAAHSIPGYHIQDAANRPPMGGGEV